MPQESLPDSIVELARLPETFEGSSSREFPVVGRGVVGVSREVFERTLFDLELMAPAELSALLASLPEASRPVDSETLARALIEARKLTRYQASAIFQGKGKILTIGTYVVLDRLGKGGMGLVFKARHRDFVDPLALKVLPPSSSKNAETVRRFRREAEVLARLEHPNLVTSYDIGEHGGVHFLVMDHVDGSDLSRIVRLNGPMRPSKAVDVIIQSARGLGAAHAKGIVHRDIKPANLMVDSKGTVRVLDLGLARVIGAKDSKHAMDVEQNASLTGTGIIMGTVDFLSPEQSKDSKRADHRADIYSLGCTFHYILTGQPPYPRETVMQRLLAHHQDDVPSIRDIRPEFPPDLDAVFRQMLAKDPEKRLQTMAKVIAALEACRGAKATGKLLLFFDDAANAGAGKESKAKADGGPGRSKPPEWPADPPDEDDDGSSIYGLAPAEIADAPASRNAMPVGYTPPAPPPEAKPQPNRWRPILITITTVTILAIILAVALARRSRPKVVKDQNSAPATVPKTL